MTLFIFGKMVEHILTEVIQNLLFSSAQCTLLPVADVY